QIKLEYGTRLHRLLLVDNQAIALLAIHFITDHTVDLAGLDVGQQTPQRWSFHVSARESTVVIAVGQADPALVGLTADEGFGRLALRVQRVELLVRPFLGRLACIDGATYQRQRGCGILAGAVHAFSLLLRQSRKKRKPLQWLSVTGLCHQLAENGKW